MPRGRHWNHRDPVRALNRRSTVCRTPRDVAHRFQAIGRKSAGPLVARSETYIRLPQRRRFADEVPARTEGLSTCLRSTWSEVLGTGYEVRRTCRPLHFVESRRQFLPSMVDLLNTRCILE